MKKNVKITILCCNYTNLAEKEDFSEISENIEIKKYPCSGYIEIVDILRAFTEGADGVMVVGCEKGTCHNKKGSERAEKRVIGAQKILEELDLNKERVQMFFVSRLNSGELVDKAKKFYEEILKIEAVEKKNDNS